MSEFIGTLSEFVGMAISVGCPKSSEWCPNSLGIRSNPSDAKRMLPLLSVISEWTGTVPEAASFDSGYCSKANFAAAKASGIKTISFAGGKGRMLLGTDWDSAVMRHLRRRRNAIEALIGHFKQCYGLRRFYERNLKAARHQLLRSIIAYNFERTAVLLLRRLKAEEEDAA